MKYLFSDFRMQEIMSNGRFLCTKCGSCFRRKNGLREHTIYECNKSPRFKCPYCPKLAKLRSNMYKHVRGKHGGREVWAVDLEEQ